MYFTLLTFGVRALALLTSVVFFTTGLWYFAAGAGLYGCAMGAAAGMLFAAGRTWKPDATRRRHGRRPS